jgi:hypothetical protein
MFAPLCGGGFASCTVALIARPKPSHERMNNGVRCLTDSHRQPVVTPGYALPSRRTYAAICSRVCSASFSMTLRT